MLQTIFNCFAKNELKRINQCTLAPPEKMAHTIRKLNSRGGVLEDVLGLEASSPQKLACPQLEDSTIFWNVKIL